MEEIKKAAEAAPKHLDKGTKIQDKSKVFSCFYKSPKTRSQVADMTGVWINSVCYYAGEFLRDGKAKVHHRGTCPVKHSNNAQFLTTNPDLFPEEKQLTFDFWKGVKL